MAVKAGTHWQFLLKTRIFTVFGLGCESITQGNGKDTNYSCLKVLQVGYRHNITAMETSSISSANLEGYGYGYNVDNFAGD